MTTTTHKKLDARDLGMFDAVGYMAKNVIHKMVRITDQSDILLDINEDVLVSVRCHTSSTRNNSETDQSLVETNNARLLLEAELELAALEAAVDELKAV
jgi:hypothetical protein